MKRVFVFSYYGSKSYHTSFYRLANIAENLAENFQVFFIHGNFEKVNTAENNDNLTEIPFVYTNNLIAKVYHFLLNKQASIAKMLLIFHYFLTGREIFDIKKEVIKTLEKNSISLNKEDIIFVSYPSLSTHYLGYALKKKFQSKLVLEYRDPGVFGYRLVFESKLVSVIKKFFLRRKEIRNLENADLVIAVSDAIKNFFPDKYQHKIQVVKNGYNIDKINFSRIKDNKNQFILAYLGSVYSGQLTDLTFFRAVRSFIDKYDISPDKFSLKFVGLNDVESIRRIINDFNLTNYTILTEKMPIENAYEELYNVSMFFHMRFGNRKEIITTKQYEYLAFQKPILLPVNDHGDLEESIKKYNAGFICNNEDEAIEVLKKAYINHFEGKFARITRTEEELYELSRKAQGGKLLALMSEL